jgi:hypothetical protein
MHQLVRSETSEVACKEAQGELFPKSVDCGSGRRLFSIRAIDEEVQVQSVSTNLADGHNAPYNFCYRFRSHGGAVRRGDLC